MKSRLLWLAVCLLAVTAAVVYWRRGNGQGGPATPLGAALAAPSEIAPEPLSPDADEVGPSVRTARHDWTAPLAQVYSELAAAAKAGDRTALRQLIEGLQRCRGLESGQQTLGLHELMLDPEGRIGRQLRQTPGAELPGGVINVMGHTVSVLKPKISEDARYCGKLRPDQLATLGPWLLAAARAGDGKAAMEYANGQFLEQDLFNQLDAVRQWREEAPALLEQALSLGMPEASSALARSYDPDKMTGPRQPQSDPLRALAYYQVSLLAGQCQPDCQVRIRSLTEALSPQAVAEADQQAAQVCQRQPTACRPAQP